jgi:DNA-binding MarR family transcriptional regulator
MSDSATRNEMTDGPPADATSAGGTRIAYETVGSGPLVALVEGGFGRADARELAAKLTISRGGMTKLVDRLEDAGLLAREPASHDRRGSSAVLTPAAETMLRRMWPTYSKVLADDGKTLMTMIQRGLPTAELREEHRAGLPNAFARLQRAIEN